MLARLDHLVLTAILQDKRVRIILNLEANRSYISLRLKNKLAQNKYKKDKLYSLTIVDEKFVNHKDR